MKHYSNAGARNDTNEIDIALDEAYPIDIGLETPSLSTFLEIKNFSVMAKIELISVSEMFLWPSPARKFLRRRKSCRHGFNYLAKEDPGLAVPSMGDFREKTIQSGFPTQS